MTTAHLTGKEIDFLLYISRFQDERGRVAGVHYKALCGEMHMSHQEFYNAMRALEEKGFIRCGKTNRIDHDIVILGNVYAGREKEYQSEGYVTTSHNIFYCEDFRELKAGAKLLAMIFMQIGMVGTKKGMDRRYRIGIKNFYEKYTKLLGVTKRVVRTYLRELKQFFTVERREKMYCIFPKRVVEKKKYAKSEADNYREHSVDVICRRNRICDARMKEKNELRDLLFQYRQVAAELHTDLTETLARAVYKSLEMINEGIRGTWKRTLNVRLVHKLMRKELGIA